MTRRQHPEEDLARTVAAYLDLALPEDACWTTIPAGGGGRVRGAKLKAVGYKPGWPDLQIVYRGQLICIELKAKYRSLSPEQEAMHERLRLAGAGVGTAKSVESVEQCLRTFGVPLRASTGTRAA